MKFDLTPEEKSILLRIARSSIESRWVSAGGEKRKEPERRPEGGGSALAAECGAFVTLHLGKSLRGCIGRMSSQDPLIETVKEMAKESAFGDPRFPPLRHEELEKCRIEISVLSPMEPCADLETVQVGVHGLYLAKGGRAGVFLPQVPLEQGWNRKEYLDHLCGKAGLPVGAYDDPDAKVFTFTAVVFGEEES